MGVCVCVCTCFGNREECWRDIVLALPSWMLLSFQPFQPLLASAASWHTDRQSELAKYHHHYCCCCCCTKASSTPLLFPTIFFWFWYKLLASRMGVSLEELEPKQEPEKKRGRECICEYPNNCTKKNLCCSCYWCWCCDFLLCFHCKSLHESQLHPIGLVYSFLRSRYLSISVLPWGQESLDVLARQENPRVTRQETNRPHDPRSPRNPQYQNTHTHEPRKKIKAPATSSRCFKT